MSHKLPQKVDFRILTDFPAPVAIMSNKPKADTTRNIPEKISNGET